MLKKLCVFLSCFSFLALFATEKTLSSVEFMNILRDGIARNNGSSYAILAGTLEHIRRGDSEAQEYPIFMGVIITPERSMTQIIITIRALTSCLSIFLMR